MAYEAGRALLRRFSLFTISVLALTLFATTSALARPVRIAAHPAQRKSVSQKRRHKRHHRAIARVTNAKRTRAGTSSTPSAPSNLSGNPGNQQATLTWTASTDSRDRIAGYYLYRNSAQVAKITNSTSYTNTGLTNGTSYSYDVVAYDTSGNLSLASATVSVTPQALPPANTAAPAISGQAVVGQTLTASTGTWSNSPTAYTYQWSDCNSSGASCAAISGATGSSYVLASSDVGFTVEVSVIASNSGGSASATSAPTVAVSATAPAVSWPASYTNGPLGANNILPASSNGVFLIDWFGYSGYTWSQQQSAVLQREAGMGRKFDGIGLNYGNGSSYNGVANCIDSSNSMAQWVHNQGSVPIVTWSPNANLDQIASGAFDNCYAGVADYFKQFGFRIMLRMMWEQDGNWFPWSACSTVSSTATPSEYVADWQRIVNIFKAQGATNVGFFWTPEEGYNRSCADATYPGNSYVDWVGTDQYNADNTSWSTPLHSGWADFNEMFNYTSLGSSIQSREAKYGPMKPFIVGETGSKYDTSNATHKASWFQNIASVAAPSMPYLHGVEFFDQWVSSEGNDWRLDSNQPGVTTTVGSTDSTTYQGFLNMAHAPAFNTGIAGGAF